MFYVDIHNHMLPGVDDGSQSMEQSMKMLKIAYEEGIRAVCLTPHYMPPQYAHTAEELHKRKDQLQKRLIKNGIGIRLYLGNEIYYRDSAAEDVLGRKALTLENSRYVLVEFNVKESADRIERAVHSLANSGLRPVIAHLERYENLAGDLDMVEDLIDTGAYVQVNAGSIMGDYGHKLTKWTRTLLKNDLVHMVATDSHNETGRAPKLRECAEYLTRKFGEEYARLLLWENPCKVIENKFIHE